MSLSNSFITRLSQTTTSIIVDRNDTTTRSICCRIILFIELESKLSCAQSFFDNRFIIIDGLCNTNNLEWVVDIKSVWTSSCYSYDSSCSTTVNNISDVRNRASIQYKTSLHTDRVYIIVTRPESIIITDCGWSNCGNSMNTIVSTSVTCNRSTNTNNFNSITDVIRCLVNSQCTNDMVGISLNTNNSQYIIDCICRTTINNGYISDTTIGININVYGCTISSSSTRIL